MTTYKRKKLLLLSKAQYGYLTDLFQLVNYLSRKFEIKVICYDEKKVKLYPENDNIKIKYVKKSKIKIIDNILFFLTILLNIYNFKLIFVYYFYGCSIFKIFFPKKIFIIDIRTGSVIKNKIINLIANKLITFESNIFDEILVLSDSLSKKLSLNKIKTRIAPIIPNKIKFAERKFDVINLLYIGTLFNRRIEDTIIGFKEFIKDNSKYEDIIANYFIVCDRSSEYYLIKKLIKEQNLEKKIIVFEWLPPNKISDFFVKANVGISYIPINDIYNAQTPTKSIEYMLSGMPVIATKTFENIRLINEKCGLLCEDNPQSFYLALKKFVEIRHQFNSFEIYSRIKNYEPFNIVEKYYLPIINKYIEN